MWVGGGNLPKQNLEATLRQSLMVSVWKGEKGRVTLGRGCLKDAFSLGRQGGSGAATPPVMLSIYSGLTQLLVIVLAGLGEKRPQRMPGVGYLRLLARQEGPNSFSVLFFWLKTPILKNTNHCSPSAYLKKQTFQYSKQPVEVKKEKRYQKCIKVFDVWI